MISEPVPEEFVRYDPAVPVAVFLGPSLERRRAEEILRANYYPPVRMGDVYRLIGSGVKLIVLVDGVFHRQAPVWQREIVEAIRNGITVVGASSMGALRAAELHPFGMIGHGTIFEWFRDGVLDGDDEVALNHGDAGSGFRALSEPLVNIRATLAEAVRRGHLSAEEAAALIAPVKQACYVERSWRGVLQSLPEARWPGLREFLETSAINLKERDALGALRFAASLRISPPQIVEFNGVIRSSFHQTEAVANRGFLHPAGYLVSGRWVLMQAAKDQAALAALTPDLVRRHFLLLWAREKRVTCPEDWRRDFRARRCWPGGDSLPAAGLTARERDLAVDEEALLEWLRVRGPEYFGLRFDQHRRYLEALLPLHAPADTDARRAEFLGKAAETCILADWARTNGVALSTAEAAAFLSEWEKVSGITDRRAWLQSVDLPEADYLAISAERALYHTLGVRGPGFFGYESWSFDCALLRHLQLTGGAADLVGKLLQLS